MSLLKLALASAVLCAVVTASPIFDTWVEDASPVPSEKPIALLDESLSRAKAFLQQDDEVIHNSVLAVQLDAVNPIVDLTKSDDDLLVLFTIFNPSNESVKLSKRDTPLEGQMFQNMFVIHTRWARR